MDISLELACYCVDEKTPDAIEEQQFNLDINIPDPHSLQSKVGDENQMTNPHHHRNMSKSSCQVD